MSPTVEAVPNESISRHDGSNRRVQAAMRSITPRTRVLAFGALLALGGALMLLATPHPLETAATTWTAPIFALVLAFGVAESTALHVEIRKESHSLSLSAIPLMFGLFIASPVVLATAYICGAAPAMLCVRRSGLVKTTWNLCLFFCEAALASMTVRLILGLEVPTSIVDWFAPLIAVLLAELLSLIAVSLVIMVVDVKFRPNLFADVGQSQILAALAGTFTVTALAASISDPWMMLFALVPVIGVGVLMRSTGEMAQRHKDLQQLHGFTRALTNERGSRTVDTGLTELVQIMRARSAGLLLVADDGSVPSSLRVLEDDTIEDHDATVLADRLVAATAHDSVQHLEWDSADHAGRALLQECGARSMLAVNVLQHVDRTGVLFVTDRLGMRSEYAPEELRLFGSLANTLSARLSNDHLVEQLEVQAQHDALTGLANRLSFEVALSSVLADDQRSGVVVMVDLDRFKEINDSLGHDMGDKLLIEVARRLQTAPRSTDMVARLGGDEFAMFLTRRDTDGPDDFNARLAALHARLCAQVDIDGITFDIGASVGVARWPQHGATSDEVLRHADTAMYEAKRQQSGLLWYEPSLDADAPRRLDLYMSARGAFDRDDLYVNYQLQVSARTGEISGAEALGRWRHDVYGDVPPDEFVPLIAQAGLNGRLTRLVLERSIDAAKQFEAAGLDVPIALNLTPHDLLDRRLARDVSAMLDAARVGPDCIHVEVTESGMVVDFETSVKVLSQLRDLGVLVAIDDFGTGYSSLQHLHRLPVDKLKIDRSFVSTMLHDPRAAAIVRSSVNLASDLGLRTVAEGVESEQQFRAVQRLGASEVQGFYVHRPASLADSLTAARNWERIVVDDDVFAQAPVRRALAAH